jgi:adenosylmethionine-8-amino-7-oxononanoate aminotransferase
MHDADALAALDHAHLWHPFTQQQQWTAAEPVVIERAEGCWLVDTRGRRYLDGVSSLWTNVHGHRHPGVDAAVTDQLGRVAHSTLLGLSNVPAVQLAARLVQVAPAGLSRVFYSDNGSTAAEIALKMAFQYQRQIGQTQRTKFAGLRDGYHGDTLGAVSVGAIDLFHGIFRPLLFDAVALPAPVTPGGEEEDVCLERALALLDAHGDELAAVVVEPLVQGAAGMKMHSARYLEAIAARAAERGALVIADEVAVGMGRLGTLFAVEQTAVAPDMVCLAKGLSAGYLPLAATLASERVYEAFLGGPRSARQLFHGHTYTGNPLACAAALACLDAFEAEGTLEHVRRLAAHIAERTPELLATPGIGAVRHRGVMVGVDLCAEGGGALDPALSTGHRVAMACRPRGAIVRPLGDTVVINPPLALSLDELDQLMDVVIAAVGDVQA